MSIKSFIAVTLALVATTAFAQDRERERERLGIVDNVQGLVTVTDGATGSTVATGNLIISGMRFVTSSSGSAVLRFDNGCVLKLEPSHAVTILHRETCEALIAGVQPVGGTTVAGASSFTQGALATGGLAATGILLRNRLDNNSLSSN